MGVMVGGRKPGIMQKGRNLVFPPKGEKSLTSWWKSRIKGNVRKG